MKTNAVSKSVEKTLTFRQDQGLPYEDLAIASGFGTREEEPR